MKNLIFVLLVIFASCNTDVDVKNLRIKKSGIVLWSTTDSTKVRKIDISQKFFTMYIKENDNFLKYYSLVYKNIYTNLNIAEAYHDSMKLSMIKSKLYWSKYTEYQDQEMKAILAGK